MESNETSSCHGEFNKNEVTVEIYFPQVTLVPGPSFHYIILQT